MFIFPRSPESFLLFYAVRRFFSPYMMVEAICVGVGNCSALIFLRQSGIEPVTMNWGLGLFTTRLDRYG